MKPTTSLRTFLLLAGSSLIAAFSAHAQSTWTPTAGGSYNWQTPANWDTNPTIPNATGAVANLNLNISGDQTISLNGAVTLGTLNLGDTATTFVKQTIQAGTGGSLTFNNSGSGAQINYTASSVGSSITAGVTLNDSLAISNLGTGGKNNPFSITGKITGTGGITVSGAGSTYLSSTTNDYSGGLTLSGGSIQTGSNAATFGSGTITINSGTVDTSTPGGGGSALTTTNSVIMNGGWTLSNGGVGTATWNINGGVTLGADIALGLANGRNVSFGGIIDDGVNSYKLTQNGGGVVTLGNANTYGGGTRLNAGTMNINNASAIGTGTLELGNTTGTTAVTINNSLGSAVALSTNNAQTWNQNFTFTGSNDLNLGTGAVTYTAARTVTVTGGKLTVGGDIAGEFSFTKAGAGTLTLNGTGSTFGVNASATVQITAGTLEVAKLSDKGVASSIGNANADYSLRIGNGTTLRYIGTGDSTNYRLQYGGGGTTTIESSGSGALNFTSTQTLGAFSTGTAQTIILGGTNTGNNTFSQLVNNNGAGIVSLTKEGPGKWILTNTNLYSGATNINNGILAVNGTGSINNSAVTINGGDFRYNSSTAYTGTLTFTSGTISGTNLTGSLDNQTIGLGKTISPGNSPGTASTGSQTWATGGSYEWEINSTTVGGAGTDPGWDLVNGTGTLNITASAGNEFTIDITSLTLGNLAGNVGNFIDTNNYIWLIADFNAITNFAVDAFTLDTSAFSNAFTGTFGITLGGGSMPGDNSQIYLTYTAVPEPTAALLGSLGGLLLLRRRR